MKNLTLCLLIAALPACREPAPADPPAPAVAPTGPLTVVASFYPLADFARRIGGAAVQVSVPVGDADPAHWRPDAAAIAGLQAADLVLLNGANFEQWAGQVALPGNRTVDTTAGVKDALLTFAKAVHHQHGSAGAHDHAGIDGHTWLDPVLAKAQASAVHAALVAARPAQKAAFDAGLAALARDLDALAAELAALPKRPLLASHPAYNYLARRYGWSILTFDLDPDAAPTAEQVAAIRAQNEAHGAQVMLWETAPGAEARAAMAALGVRSVVYSPVEHAPPQGDFVAAMRANVAALKAP